MEGLARVTALLPAPEAAKAGQRLTGPFLQAAQTDLQNNPGDHFMMPIMPAVLIVLIMLTCQLYLLPIALSLLQLPMFSLPMARRRRLSVCCGLA